MFNNSKWFDTLHTVFSPGSLNSNWRTASRFVWLAILKVCDYICKVVVGMFWLCIFICKKPQQHPNRCFNSVLFSTPSLKDMNSVFTFFFRGFSRKSTVYILPRVFLLQHLHLLFPRPLDLGGIWLAEKTGGGWRGGWWTSPRSWRGVSIDSGYYDKATEGAIYQRRSPRNGIARRCYFGPFYFMVSWSENGGYQQSRV